MSLNEKSGMLRNHWHDMGVLEVCREFFPDGKPAGLAIRMKKGETPITNEHSCWLNMLGVQNMINILTGETKYVGSKMLEIDWQKNIPDDLPTYGREGKEGSITQ